ncbi:MAG: hypothetical protein JWL62_3275, partial [Hyphomicrobiales bacterium]|nr:hypothetical protein [Hyphomicrobiales bacterium]
DGRATLLETANGVTIGQVLAASEADLFVPDELRERERNREKTPPAGE